jgi:hypothetical protein
VKLLLAASCAVGGACLFFQTQLAAESLEQKTLSSSANAQKPQPDKLLDIEQFDLNNQQFIPLTELEKEATTPTPTMAQVTSVSELRDLSPGDWAYEALRSLVERYGCIVGYPNQTYRGQQSLSRYEFAAGLNACSNEIERLIAQSETIAREDLETLQRLAQEFDAELATLGTRVDNLEGRVAFLEDNQFSTTTKLTGSTWFNLTGAFSDGLVRAERGVANSPFVPPVRDPITNQPSVFERDDPQITFSYYTWLTFNTSFTGRDALVTQLVTGNGNSPANQLVSAGFFNTWGTPFLDQSGALEPNSVAIRELFYSFPIGESLQIAVGPRLNFYRYFDSNRFTFFLTGATSFNSNGSTLSNTIDRGSGAVVTWNISEQLKLTAAYLGQSTEFVSGAFNTASNPEFGIFNPTNTISGELAFSPSENFNLRFLYTRSNIRAFNGLIGGTAAEPIPYGFVDDGFGGAINNATADAFVVNFDWLITNQFGIFGRYSYGSTDIDPVDPLVTGGNLNVQSFQFGLGFLDFLKEGSLGVISFVVPFDYLDGREFLLSGGGNGATQYELEASYHYPVTDNVAIIPAFYFIWNPNNFDDNPMVFVSNFRAQFSF